MKKQSRLCAAVFAVHALAPSITLAEAAGTPAPAASAPSCTTAVIATGTGPICGVSEATSTGKQANAFLGIPFAESTAGEKRWTPPVAKQPWTKTFDAVRYGPVCPQFVNQPPDDDGGAQKAQDNPPQSEDCLSVNVWTPADMKSGARLPVMVFIYGGAFSAGYSSDLLYDGAYLAANKDVILVSFNYRLGVLGFLATDELSGNYGFMDQQMALSWVQKHIRSFGGDPAKVTLFGESAGAMSVGLHLFSAPGSAKLFRAGIMESNFFSLPYKTRENQANVGNIYKQGLNCRDVKCLRGIAVNDLLVAEDAFTPDMSTVFSGAKYYLPFSPAIDGVLLTRQPVVAAQEGWAAKPILMGTNKNEAILLTEGQSISPAGYSAWNASLFGKQFQRTIAKYPAQSDSNNRVVWADIQTDDFLKCSTRYVGAKVKSPVYAYLFNRQPSFKVWGGPACRTDDNVCHGAELPFVFHSADKIGGQFTADEEKLSDAMVDYWTNFAKYLDPNGGPASSAVRWPKFTARVKEYLMLNTPQVTVQDDPYRGICDFWDSVGYNLVGPWVGKR